MIYEFDSVVIDGWEVAIEGRAEFIIDPRMCDPIISLDGFDTERNPEQKPLTAECSPTLHALISKDLTGRQMRSIMSQWADERDDRREAESARRHEALMDSYI